MGRKTGKLRNARWKVIELRAEDAIREIWGRKNRIKDWDIDRRCLLVQEYRITVFFSKMMNFLNSRVLHLFDPVALWMMSKSDYREGHLCSTECRSVGICLLSPKSEKNHYSSIFFLQHFWRLFMRTILWTVCYIIIYLGWEISMDLLRVSDTR